MAQKFMEKGFNSEHGIKSNLVSPSDTLSNKTAASHRVDSAGLKQPDKNPTSNVVSSHKSEVQAAIDNFNDHQGNVVGNQISAQAKASYHLGKDAVNGLANLISSGDEDIKTGSKK